MGNIILLIQTCNLGISYCSEIKLATVATQLKLNPNRNTKRRAPEQIENICQQFEDDKFNFTTVPTNEILFNMVKDYNKDLEVHALIINVSPITWYHTLLCPFIHKRLPQVVTEESLQVALDIMFLAPTRDFRIGFNSLCALASVNHLHYHLFIERTELHVESAKCTHLKGPLYFLEKDYPAQAFCFELQTEAFTAPISKEIYKLIEYLLKNSIAHNIFMTRGRGVVPGAHETEVVRVLVWPRKSSSGAKQLSAFNVAVCEFSGWFPVYDEEDFENLRAEDLETELRKWRFDNFDELCEEVKLLF